MVTEAQHNALIDECKNWYDTLASYRKKINGLKEELYFFAPGKTDKEILEGIEHFHNQFHIQLINIHDLKHEIKYHVSEAGRHPDFGHRIPHHYIQQKYNGLVSDLDQLESEFHGLVESA